MLMVNYMHLCDYAGVVAHGKACLVGIFDAVFAKTFPVTHPVMCLAASFHGQPHHTEHVTLEIVPPDHGTPIVHIETDVRIGEAGAGFAHVTMIGVKFEAAGDYQVRVVANGTVISSQTLRVRPAPSSPPAR